MPLDDLPDWLPAWCLDHLGGGPADVLFREQAASMVFDLRLTGGRDVVVKARADDGRARPSVLGYADFEAQNLRWHGQQVWAVNDWDSLAWQPEAALAGGASGTFASSGPPTLAPVESSEAFLVAYQDLRERSFTAAEQEVAWAASLWTAAYNAREEALHGRTAVSGDALRAQAAERLRRAGT